MITLWIGSIHGRADSYPCHEGAGELRGIVSHYAQCQTSICRYIKRRGAARCHGRYRSWSGNLGASHPVQDRRPLAHRLRNAPEVQRRAVELLHELDELLMYGTLASSREWHGGLNIVRLGTWSTVVSVIAKELVLRELSSGTMLISAGSYIATEPE